MTNEDYKTVVAICDLLGAPHATQIPGSDIYATTATIFPDAAALVLSHYHIDTNRPQSPATYRKYAKRIAARRWRLTSQPIAFDTDGRLFDGQNRLKACSIQDEPFTTLVLFNVDQKAVLNVDSGKKRGSSDYLRFAGISISKKEIAAMNRMVRGTGPNRFEGEENIEMFNALSDALQFISVQFPANANGIAVEPVLAAIGRAYYSVPADRLSEFCRCLRDRVIAHEDSDGAALTLIKYLDKSRESKVSKSETWRVECYLKACRAIKAFASYQNVKSLSASTTFEYQLPEHVREKLVANMPWTPPKTYARH